MSKASDRQVAALKHALGVPWLVTQRLYRQMQRIRRSDVPYSHDRAVAWCQNELRQNPGPYFMKSRNRTQKVLVDKKETNLK